MIKVNSSVLLCSSYVLDRFPPNYISFWILIGRGNDGERRQETRHCSCHVINTLVWPWMLWDRRKSSVSQHRNGYKEVAAPGLTTKYHWHCSLQIGIHKMSMENIKSFYTARGLNQSHLYLHSRCFIFFSCCSIQGELDWQKKNNARRQRSDEGRTDMRSNLCQTPPPNSDYPVTAEKLQAGQHSDLQPYSASTLFGWRRPFIAFLKTKENESGINSLNSLKPTEVDEHWG